MNSSKKRHYPIILCFTFLTAIISSCSNRTETNLDTQKNSAKLPISSEVDNKTVIPEKFKPLFGVNAGPGAFWPDTEGPSHGFKDVTEQYQDIGVGIIRVSDFFGAGDMMNYFPISMVFSN